MQRRGVRSGRIGARERRGVNSLPVRRRFRQKSVNPKSLPTMSDPTSLASLLRVCAALGIILFVFFVVLRGLKKFQPALVGGYPEFRVIASLALSPRERLLLVQVGEQQLLLGSGPQGLSCLHLLPQALELKKADPAFSDWLRKTRSAPPDRSP
jgi:flagellar protein FliO/FliZ